MAASVTAGSPEVRGAVGSRAQLGRSLARLVAAAALVWAVLVALGYLLTHALQDTSFEHSDGSIDRWFARHRSEPWNSVTHWLTYGAETITVIVIGVLFFVGMRIRLHRWRESLFLLAALVGEVTIFVSTTLVIDRPRPPVAHLDTAPPTSSFPSGHTAASVALYGALAIIAVRASSRRWLRNVAVAVALLMPICVAFARLYRGMHYPSDVLGGAVLSAVWLTVAWLIVLRPGAHARTGRR